MKKTKTLSLIISTILVVSAVIPFVAADVQLTSRFDAIGHYGVVANGVGLTGTMSGSIDLDVPGTVVAAYLYWSGIDIQAGGDNTITFEGASITADETYGPEFWYDDNYHFVYFEDVTNQVTVSADNTYSISDLEMGRRNYGAGLVVVYENAALPLNRIILMDGLDGFWFGWNGDLGPNSEAACFTFDPTAISRDADILLVVAGTEHDNRPNEVWTDTGSGVPSANIITSPTAVGGPYPLVGADGAAWDTYTDSVTVSAGDTWLCSQVESIVAWEASDDQGDLEGRGTSALMIAAAVAIPITQQSGLSPGFWKHNVAVALGAPGSYSSPHEGDPHLTYNDMVTLTAAAGFESLQDALDALSAKGPGSATIRLSACNAFNEAAGYAPYSD